MSWLFSQALVEEFLGDTSLDGEQSAPLSGSNTQQAYCAPDKMTAFSRLSRFGMMYKPLTASHGEELLMSYLAGFPAKTSQPQGGGQELMGNDQECGQKWHASFTKYSLVTHSWKTHQCSLLGDLDEFSETWPQWGLMRDGECWEQRMLEQTIRGTEFGLLEKWATPAVYEDRSTVDQFQQRMKTHNRTVEGAELSMQVRMNAAGLWPTPCSTDYKGSGKTGELRDRLDYAVERGATKSKTYSEAPKNGGQLNPMWVEWLMGWPLGWTDLKPLETDKSHFVQQQHGES
jgi:hypothetical protein